MPIEALDVYKDTAEYFSVDGYKLAYWQVTSKKHPDLPTVLFIHGFPSASWDWHHQWTPVLEHYDVLAVDMLGFGLSDKPKDIKYSVTDQAQWIAKLCQKLGISTVKIIAHDYGVSVAQQLLREQRDKTLAFDIESICFLNGGLFADLHRPLLTQKLLHSPLGPLLARVLSKRSLKRGFSKIFAPHSPPRDTEIETLWALMSHNRGQLVLPRLLDYLDERAKYQSAWIDAMSNTPVPLGFINGVHDPISGRHMLRHFESLFPDYPTLAVDAGHYPQLESPQIVTDAILQFLQYNKFEQ